MKVSVMTGIRNVQEMEYPLPEIAENEVLIKVMHCGICGSDLHYYEEGRIGDFVVHEPMILGHECAGEIIEVGNKVTKVNKGDLVAVEPGYTCGKCEYCKTGRYNLCPDVVFLATPPYDGAFAEYLKYPEDMVFKLPDGMDTIEGALIEPFCVGLHAVRQGDAKLGDSAVILGAGCIGLCTMLALHSMGIHQVYLADILENRLEKGIELGAAGIIRAGSESALEKIMEFTGGQGTDLVFETAGSPYTTAQTASLVKKGGTVILVGMAADATVSYDFGTLMNKEARIHTVFRYRNLYPVAIKAAHEGKIRLKDIATHYYTFSQITEALEESVKNKAEVIKAVIEM